MSQQQKLGPPPVDELSDLSWARVERNVFARMEGTVTGAVMSREVKREGKTNWVWLAVPAAAAAAFGLAFFSTRTDMPGSRIVGVLALLPMLVPPFILVVGWVALADPSAGLINIAASLIAGPRTVLVDLNTMGGLIWVTGLFLTPYVYLLVAAGFRNSDSAMEEAARVAGAGRWRLLTTIVLPLQRPALLAALLLVVIMSAGDFKRAYEAFIAKREPVFEGN